MLAADAAVVQKIVDIALEQAKTIELPPESSIDKNIHHFTTKPVHELIAEAPKQLSLVKVMSLQGFADLITNKLDDLDQAKFLIQVNDQANVSLIAKNTDEWGRRLELVHATPVPFERFKFNEWMKQDEFVIGVASLFSDNEDKAYVIRIAGALTAGESAISEVDSFTQRVTVKAGMSLPESIDIKPFVMLAPFRTFPECGQPISRFVLRAKVDGTPHLKLIEADGGRWKIDAINEIRRFISVLNTGIEIVA